MSETVASALQFIDEERTRETRQFIRMMDLFFDALNVKNPLEGMVKRKSFCLPYYTPKDERFKVLSVCTVGITLEYPFCIVSGWRKTFSDTLMNGRKKCQRDRDTRMLRKRECALVKRHWKASGSLVTQ